jgi:hypothetical protein
MTTALAVAALASALTCRTPQAAGDESVEDDFIVGAERPISGHFIIWPNARFVVVYEDDWQSDAHPGCDFLETFFGMSGAGCLSGLEIYQLAVHDGPVLGFFVFGKDKSHRGEMLAWLRPGTSLSRVDAEAFIEGARIKNDSPYR